jgi:hypothetical protein
MNAKTLADFRVGHGAALEDLLIDSFAGLVMAGVASLDRVAQDGVRVRASAGAASFRRHSTLEDCREEVAQAVRRLREEASRDPCSASRREAAAQLRAARDRQRRVEKALTLTRELHGQQQDRARRREERAFREKQKRSAAGESDLEKEKEQTREKEPRASTTDPEARVMKMADGGFRPAYNVQFASDTQSGAVAGVAIDSNGSDMGKMAPMNEALAENYGYSDPELRRRTGLGLHKGEARNTLARAIFFNRLGELRDRSFENQAYRASGLALRPLRNESSILAA